MSPRLLELALMARLPWPNEQQQATFVEHLCWAHSWYKHLPFARSAELVVFVADDAGAGFEGRERSHYGWKTTEEYRRRFGMLDYVWRLPGEPRWQRDAGGEVEPSAELVAAAGFNLGPTCSNDFNAIEVLCGLYRDELPAADPRRSDFEALDRLRDLADDAYGALSEEERECVAQEDLGGAADPRPSIYVFRERRASLHARYEKMRAPEVAAIESAIHRLDAVLRVAAAR